MRYRVLVGARDVMIKTASGSRIGGLFATRFVTASSEDSAISTAIQRVMADPELDLVADKHEIQEALRCEQIQEVPWYRARLRSAQGFTLAILED